MLRPSAPAAALCFAALVTCTLPCASQAAFRNPLNPGPDPYLTHWQGNYYLTVTGGNGIRIWKSPTLGGLKQAPGQTVWTDGTGDRCCHIWASEFYLLTGPAGPHWYLYYTADDNTDQHHRMHVLESQGTDPMGPYQYKARLQTDPKNEFYAIDGTILRHPNGNLYFLWAGYPDHRIYIIRMENPWTTMGERTLIPADGFGCPEVREGPFVLQRNGRLFLTYSACDTQKPDYKLGMVIAEANADPLKAASWIQYPTPIFQRNDANGVYGPGHHSFFQSPDGKEDWILYHGKTSSDYTYSGRTTRAQKFSWTPAGMPDFGIPLSLDSDIPAPSGDGTAGVSLVLPLRKPARAGIAAPGTDISGRKRATLSGLAFPPVWLAYPIQPR